MQTGEPKIAKISTGFEGARLILDHYRTRRAHGLAGPADDALIRLNDGDHVPLFRENSHRAGLEAVLADRACVEIQGHIGHPSFASKESCVLLTYDIKRLRWRVFSAAQGFDGFLDLLDREASPADPFPLAPLVVPPGDPAGSQPHL